MLLLLAAMTAASAQATDIAPLTPEEFNDFAMTYFERPRPDLIDRAMVFFDRSGIAESPEHDLASVMTISCIAHRADQRNHQWDATIDSLGEPARGQLRIAVATSPDELLAKVPLSPQKNDMNWACYFATGATKYLDNLLEVAANYGERKDMKLYLVAGTAMWSLSSNSRFPEVRQYLQSSKSRVAKAVLATTPEAVQAEMRDTLAEQHRKGIW